MSKAQVRCAVYTRKSSEEGLEQSFNSLEAQREACVAYIQSQKHEGWVDIKEHYDDGGFSGGNIERPALNRLLDEIRAGRIETVIVYKVDRLTRSLSDFAKIIEVFDSRQVSFVSVTQQFNTTTSMGRLTLNVLLSFAQFERELTGERIRDKVAASKKKGMWMGGWIPVGYDCVDRRLIVNKAQAETVREIFNQYLRQDSVSKLRDYLQQRQIRSKIRTSSEGHRSGGAFYSRGALHHLLNNRIYIGEIVHGKMSYPGQHESIISRKVWDEVAERLKANDRAHRTGKPTATSSLLTGILRDTSGIRLTPTHAVKKGKRYRYYTSQAVIQKRGERPQVARFPAIELENLVTAEIHRLLGSVDKYVGDRERIPETDLVAERARMMADQWPLIGGAKQREFIRAVVKSVIVGQKNLWIDVDKIRLLTELLGHTPAGLPGLASGKAAVIKLRIDCQPFRRGAELRMHVREDTTGHTAPVPSLVKATARARVWYEQLISGEVRTVEQLAQQSGCTSAYITRILQCAVLGPRSTESILSGSHPRHFTLKRILEDFPLDWRTQEQTLFPTFCHL